MDLLQEMEQSANIVSESRNLVGDADSASLYFDDDASYVDADSMKLEAVSRNYAMSSQKCVEEPTFYSEMTDAYTKGMVEDG